MDSTVSINIHGSNVVSHTFRRGAVRFGVVPKSQAHQIMFRWVVIVVIFF
jgi:hypothetical protein